MPSRPSTAYDGNVVNLAARLAALADPGTALTTAALLDVAGERVGAEPLPPRALKGLPEPVTAFRLIS